MLPPPAPQAVNWAREGKWDLLEEYCMKDTILTHQISAEQQLVTLPLSWRRRSSPVVAICEHRYCPSTNVHEVLNFRVEGAVDHRRM